MAVTRGTLQIARRLRKDIGTEVDSAARTLTGEWVDAWDGLATAWQAAADELVTEAVRADRWPPPARIMRMDRVNRAMGASIDALGKLAERTETVAADAADRVVALDGEYEARIVASQAPEGEAPALAQRVAGLAPVESLREAWALTEQARDDVQLLVLSRIRTDATQVMARRAREQIHSDVLPLSDSAVDSMRRELVRGVDVGDNPRTAAARMVANVEGQFNGGLTRALTIARTETLDAYRSTSATIHGANADVVPGWQWLSELDHRCCPSCWAMHGQQFPTSVPGPDDHQQGRCARIPVLASWAELGITAPEPSSAMVDAQARFLSLPRSQQLEIMGQARLALLDEGRIGWGDLSKVRDNPGWRTSRVPTPVRDLRRRADRGLAPTPGPQPPAPAPRLATSTLPAPARPSATTPPTPAPPPPTQPVSRFHRDLDGIEDLAAAVERSTVVERRALTGGAQAEVELVTFADGTRLVHKTGGSPDAEQLASALGRSLGVRTPRVYRNGQNSVWMDYVEDGVTAIERLDVPQVWAARQRLAQGFTTDAERIGLLDVLIGNVDRNPGNWMLTPAGRTVAIDHGFGWEPVGMISTLPPGRVVNRVIIDGPFAERFRGRNPLTTADVAKARRRLEALRPQFVHLGRTDWLDFSLAVLDDIAPQASGSRNVLA